MGEIKKLDKLTNAVAETVIEAVQGRPWTAFVNNTFDFGNVALGYKQLISDFLAVEADPDLLDNLKQSVLNHPKVKEVGDEKAGRLFIVIWSMIVFNAKGALACKAIIEE